MDRTDLKLQLSYLSLPRRPTGLGVCGQQAEGSGVALWACCGLSSLLEFNKEMQGGEGGGTDFLPIDLPLCRGWRSDEGVSGDVVFYGVTVVGLPDL